MPVRKEVEEERKGNGAGCRLIPRVHECRVLCFEAFSYFLQVGILGEVSRQVFSRIFINSPDVPFQGHGLH